MAITHTWTEKLLDVHPEAPVQAGVDLYTVTYLSQGLRVKALLAIPQSEGPFPAILYCRGGYKGVGRVRPERISQLAAFGYIIFAPHYRGNEGGEGWDEFGGEDRQDVYSAFHVLASMNNVQKERISLYGFSRGGMMALFAAMECSGIHAAVVWSGVSDMLLTYEERRDLRRMLKRLVGHPEKNRAAYLERSPLYRANDVKCPILIIHGTEDQNVSVEHAKRLGERLAYHQKPFELWLVERSSHLFDSEQIETYTRKMFAWLEKPFIG